MKNIFKTVVMLVLLIAGVVTIMANIKNLPNFNLPDFVGDVNWTNSASMSNKDGFAGHFDLAVNIGNVSTPATTVATSPVQTTGVVTPRTVNQVKKANLKNFKPTLSEIQGRSLTTPSLLPNFDPGKVTPAR